MSLADSIATDWQHIDGIETVTHTERPADVSTDTVKASQGELNFREAMTGGPAGLESTDVIWIVWAATLRTGARPTQGDLITDAAENVCTILSVSVGTHDRLGATVIKYRCICRKQL